MIEIHCAFENEPAARFHLVTESHNGSQGLAMLDPVMLPSRRPALALLDVFRTDAHYSERRF